MELVLYPLLLCSALAAFLRGDLSWCNCIFLFIWQNSINLSCSTMLEDEKFFGSCLVNYEQKTVQVLKIMFDLHYVKIS